MLRRGGRRRRRGHRRECEGMKERKGKEERGERMLVPIEDMKELAGGIHVSWRVIE